MKPRSRTTKPRRPRTREIKPIPPVGPAGDTDVRPVERKTAVDYHPGAKPPERDPWQDEGEPETNG